MASEVKKWEEGVQLVVGKPLAWALYGLWLAVKWITIAVLRNGKRVEQWWSRRKVQFSNPPTIQTKRTA